MERDPFTDDGRQVDENLQKVLETADKLTKKNPDVGKVQPLKCITKCVATNEQILEHIKLSLKRNIPEFIPSYVTHSGQMVVVGSGPSIKDQIKSIREQREKHGRPILAVKGAHDYLIEHGVVPDVCIMLDPQEKIVDCVQKHNERTIYFLASQCHPNVFEFLKDRQIIMFHAMSNIGEEKVTGDRMRVGGGTTTGLRSFCVGWLMGFRRFHVYGFDSCLDKDGNKRVHPPIKPEKRLTVFTDSGVRFECNPAMAAQANEFQNLFDFIPGIKIRCYGSGLIPQIMKERKKKGKKDW